jgi:hypothetical protein
VLPEDNLATGRKATEPHFIQIVHGVGLEAVKKYSVDPFNIEEEAILARTSAHFAVLRISSPSHHFLLLLKLYLILAKRPLLYRLYVMLSGIKHKIYTDASFVVPEFEEYFLRDVQARCMISLHT